MLSASTCMDHALAAGVTVSSKPKAISYINGIVPVMDQGTYLHAVLEQFEARYSGAGGEFRYDGQAWYGSDYNRLWVKSEGTIGVDGRFRDGDHEILYDRPISRYFDLQSGVRLDIDHGPTRAWGAVGIQGLALYFFDAEATFYFSDRGVAGRLHGSYDILITNRLILQPQAELNFYSAADEARGVGRGLSDVDAGLRLRYEWHRKVAPYIGVTYSNSLYATGQGAASRDSGGHVNFTFGVRSWF
ncbi:copper resistance protein B [Acetobacter sp. LMG 1627]|uniref:Copper resistance protein B n=1 Tax=Acetobacter conturbans TaxID=1737472 RepID=A0ABX0K226_9PROT|nr:copper resistance protein B [Acetobacter conturbans]